MTTVIEETSNFRKEKIKIKVTRNKGCILC